MENINKTLWEAYISGSGPILDELEKCVVAELEKPYPDDFLLAELNGKIDKLNMLIDDAKKQCSEIDKLNMLIDIVKNW